MTESDQRLLRAIEAKLERCLEQLRGVKSSDATVTAWARVLDARFEVSTVIGMLGVHLKERRHEG